MPERHRLERLIFVLATILAYKESKWNMHEKCNCIDNYFFSMIVIVMIDGR